MGRTHCRKIPRVGIYADKKKGSIYPVLGSGWSSWAEVVGAYAMEDAAILSRSQTPFKIPSSFVRTASSSHDSTPTVWSLRSEESLSGQ
ncbi:hypothetical protein BT93_J0523 [Corymbia citriodora subsp. variegata]|nr:hypothetical protein BT93_J0523 [Corymbia citriodora subsp. variegata]